MQITDASPLRYLVCHILDDLLFQHFIIIFSRVFITKYSRLDDAN